MLAADKFIDRSTVPHLCQRDVYFLAASARSLASSSLEMVTVPASLLPLRVCSLNSINDCHPHPRVRFERLPPPASKQGTHHSKCPQHNHYHRANTFLAHNAKTYAAERRVAGHPASGLSDRVTAPAEVGLLEGDTAHQRRQRQRLTSMNYLQNFAELCRTQGIQGGQGKLASRAPQIF